MAPRLLILSRDQAATFEPLRREVCISIGDPNHLPVALSPKFLSVLRLNFSDITEESDLPFDLLFASEHAVRIIEFISRWKDVDQIVVHCRAGLSRSPAVAIGICELHGLQVNGLEKQHPLFNKWVRKELVRVGGEMGWPVARTLPRVRDSVDALRNPARLWARCEVLQRRSPVPAASGLYAWFFREVPPSVPVKDAIVHHGSTLLYTGIAPSRKGSSSTLRSRIRQHYAGNAFDSPLRLTLGCLLSRELGIELRSVAASRRFTFGAGEDRLSDWMAANAFVTWVEHPRPWEIEETVIAALRPPLNLEANMSHPFCEELSRIRREMKMRATGDVARE